jgi:hypothetical protein
MSKRSIAATELLLISPATLFMTALFVRNLQPLQYEPARTAQRIVTWYAVRPHLGLWGLLIALPLAVLVIGCGTLLHARNTFATLGAHLPTLLVAVATLISGAVLAIVAVHVLTN